MNYEIQIVKTSERMPEPFTTVVVSDGLARWTGKAWTSNGGMPISAPQWWCGLPDGEDIDAKLCRPEPVSGGDDPFRIRTHKALINQCRRLLESVGSPKGSLQVECTAQTSRHDDSLDVHFEVWFFGDTETISAGEDDTDPQLVFNEFERLMKSRFAPEVPVPAGLEACDGESIAKGGE